MSLIVLKRSERERLVELSLLLNRLGEQHPVAREEVMTALRCLKAVHSNSIEDKRVDRIFLQVMLHNAGIPDKSRISTEYQMAAQELRGQERMLRWLESLASEPAEFSVSMLLKMHEMVFEESWPDVAGRFRQTEVSIQSMAHQPPHFSRVPELLHQHLASINERLFAPGAAEADRLSEVLHLSGEVHYLLAHVHPFIDGNGRIARAAGDYVMLASGLYYDVIMTDYRDSYLDALEECDMSYTEPLSHFLEYSYLETLERISGFFRIIDRDTVRDSS
jgi:Fic family protein